MSAGNRRDRRRVRRHSDARLIVRSVGDGWRNLRRHPVGQWDDWPRRLAQHRAALKPPASRRALVFTHDVDGLFVSHANVRSTGTDMTAPMLRSFACFLTPHGALRLEAAEDDTAVDASVAERLEAAFRKGDGHGLLQLGLAEAGSLPAAGSRVLARICDAFRRCGLRHWRSRCRSGTPAGAG